MPKKRIISRNRSGSMAITARVLADIYKERESVPSGLNFYLVYVEHDYLQPRSTTLLTLREQRSLCDNITYRYVSEDDLNNPNPKLSLALMLDIHKKDDILISNYNPKLSTNYCIIPNNGMLYIDKREIRFKEAVRAKPNIESSLLFHSSDRHVHIFSRRTELVDNHDRVAHNIGYELNRCAGETVFLNINHKIQIDDLYKWVIDKIGVIIENQLLPVEDRSTWPECSKYLSNFDVIHGYTNTHEKMPKHCVFLHTESISEELRMLLLLGDFS